MNGWRVIKSAPRDGTVVDLWADGRIWAGFYFQPRGAMKGWYRQEGYPVTWRVLLVEPTHWRPTAGPNGEPARRHVDDDA